MISDHNSELVAMTLAGMPSAQSWSTSCWRVVSRGAPGGDRSSLRADVRLDFCFRLPSSPERQVERNLPMRLLLTRCIANVNLELVWVNPIGGTASSPQKELQIKKKPWVTDKDVHAARRLPELPHREVAIQVSAERVPLSSPIWWAMC